MSNRKYFKDNYIDVLKIITPRIYLKDDIELAGVSPDIHKTLINSHILSSKYISKSNEEGGFGLNISATPNLPDIDNIIGISKYFVKQNELVKITPQFFDNAILAPLKTNLIDFKSKESFSTFVSATLLPSIHPNSNSVSATASAFSNSNQGTHEYLTSTLTWLYFLNTSGPRGFDEVGELAHGFAPSSLVFSALTDQIYEGKSITIDYAIKMYQEYLWHNYYHFSSIDVNIIPKPFLSSTGSYTSGTQNLDKLKTLIDIVYSPLYTDRDNTKVKDSFNDYIELDSLSEDVSEEGPLHKMFKAVAYSMFDINDEVEGLNLLASIENCPSEYLPFLGDLIGWKLYGREVDSWRRQLRSAVSLYKKKGTKQGLVDAINTIIPNNPVDPANSITEFHESYIPNLIYYLLRTDSPSFQSLSTWTQERAEKGGYFEYSSSSLDLSIRYVVDELMKRCVTEFPRAFRIGNEPFRVHILNSGNSLALNTPGKAYFYDSDGEWNPEWGLGDIHAAGPTMGGPGYMTGLQHSDTSEYLAILGDPNFVFNFRGRLYPIPPWEDERYYKGTAITDDLLDFLISELLCLDVPLASTTIFKDFILNNTIRGSSKSKAHESGFLFLTSGLELPPNYERIIKNHEAQHYDYLSMWNGKSSIFNFEVCGGNFDVLYLTDTRFSKQDVLTSLRVIDDFSPAKTKPQVDFALRHVDYLSSLGNTALSYRIFMHDLHLSGGLAGSELSGISMRGNGALGQDLQPDFDDSNSHHAHALLPCFKRDQVDSLLDPILSTTSAVGGPDHNITTLDPHSFIDSGVMRNSLRRRNFKNVLFHKGKGWHSRKGDNMPVYYNSNLSLPEGSFSYAALGFVPSSLNFVPVPNHLDLPDVYDPINDTYSNNNYFNVTVSNTFPSRGQFTPLDLSSPDNYVLRDEVLDIVKVLHSITERMEYEKARIEVEENYDFFDASVGMTVCEEEDEPCESEPIGWCNLVESLKNQKNYLGYDYNEYFNRRLDQRETNSSWGAYEDFGSGLRHQGRGMYSLYKDYITHFYPKGLGGGLLASRKDGGRSILSHISGPLYYNGMFGVDGSAIATSSLLQASSFNSQYEINLNKNYAASNLSGVGVSIFEADNDLNVEAPEYRTSNIVSGIDLVDTSSYFYNRNWFSVIKLDPTIARPSSDGYFVGNKIILSKAASHGLPRIRLSLSATDDNANLLIPDHYFDLTLKCIPFHDTASELGAATVGIWIHTDVENDVNGNKIFWNLMPDGTWEMKSADLSTELGGLNNVKDNYSHSFYFEHDTTSLEDESVATTFCEEGVTVESTINVPTLQLLEEEHLQERKISFNTVNRVVVNEADYYSLETSGQNVHRANQNYIIEVFLYPGNEDKTLLLDNLSVVDRTQIDRANIVEDFTIPDFSHKDDDFTEAHNLKFKFWKPDGEEVAYYNGAEGLQAGDQIPSLLNYSYPDFDYNIPVVNYDYNSDYEFKHELKTTPVVTNGSQWLYGLMTCPLGVNNTTNDGGQIFQRGRWFEGWSNPLILDIHMATTNPQDETGEVNIGLKRNIDTVTARPDIFPSEADLSEIFPVMELYNFREEVATDQSDVVSWSIGNERFMGLPSFSRIEYDGPYGNTGVWQGTNWLEHFADASDYDFTYDHLKDMVVNRNVPWRGTIFDPTGTYYTHAAKDVFDATPTNFADIYKPISLDYNSGHMAPNAIVQDVPYTELEDGKPYVFSVYFKPGVGTSSTVTNPNDATDISSDYGTFLVTLSYLRPQHWTSWMVYNTSGNTGTQPNTGNNGNTAHWDVASSLPYTTLRFTPGNTETGKADVSSTQINAPTRYAFPADDAISKTECVKLEKVGTEGWWRASVSLHWRNDWVNRSDEYYAPGANTAAWDNKESFGFANRNVHGLRITLQCDSPYSYKILPAGDWYTAPYNKLHTRQNWKTWGSLLHEGNATETKDFQYIGGEVFVGDSIGGNSSTKELCYVDASGNVFTGTNKVSDVSELSSWGPTVKVTTGIEASIPGKGVSQTVRLNTQVSAFNSEGDKLTGLFYLDSVGLPRDTADLSLSTISDKTYGSYIDMPKRARVHLGEEEILIILRYFNSLTNHLGARRSESVSGVMGRSGGSRLNYRIHPYQMDGQISTKDSDYDQLTTINFIN